MPILTQVLVIFGLAFTGEVISGFLPFAVPGSVIGMILLFLVLNLRLVRYEDIFPTGDFLIKNMAFFFVPSSVNIMRYFPLIGDHILPFVLICFVSTLLAFFATYATTKALMQLRQRKKVVKS